MKHLEILELLGLSKTEAKLYLESLRFGPASAIQLAEKIGVTRQTIYELLPSLGEKSLVKHVRMGSRRLYQAVSPEVLMERVRLIAEKVEGAIPELKTQQAETGAVPTISVYENPLAMREWYQGMLQDAKKGEEMLVWATAASWYGLDEGFYGRFIREKARKGVVTRVIYPSSMEERKEVRELTTIATINRFTEEWWEAAVEMWVWRNQCVYLTIRQNATNLIVMESESMAKLERYKFEEKWATLEGD